MKKITLLLSLLISFTISSQTTKDEFAKIEAAKKTMGKASADFGTCIIGNDCRSCIEDFIKQADDAYEKSLVAAILYEIDAETSFQLHKEAYLANKNNLGFILEYAMELHRNGQYAEAIPLYEQYKVAKPADFRTLAWLADCYTNVENLEKATNNWNLLNFPSHHTDIDFALHTIYGDTTQLKKRSDLRNRISKGETGLLYDLIFLDNNWKIDWWNTIIQDNLLQEDMKLAKKVLGETSADYKTLIVYNQLEDLSKKGAKAEIKTLLEQTNIVIGNRPLLKYGNMMSHILRICFSDQVLNEFDFYKSRGTELLELAKSTRDKDLLNIYAYLQATVDGRVTAEIDRLGWIEFKDERFAISYFIGKADKNRYDDPELEQALVDFPHSAKLHWVKLNCAYIEKKNFRSELIHTIKKEFKTLGSDSNHYSYTLNSYFIALQEK